MQQAEASKWAEKRDTYAQDSQKAAVHTAELQAAAEEAGHVLDRLKADIDQAKNCLVALDRSVSWLCAAHGMAAC